MTDRARASLWRGVGRGLLLLPLAVGRLVGGVGQARGALVLRGACGVALGLFGWAVALPAGQGTVNGVLYPLVDAHDYQHSWGGPTLLGAWLVHALAAVPVVALALAVLWGTAAADQALEPSPGARRPWWPVPLSAAVALLAALLLNAWLHQLRGLTCHPGAHARARTRPASSHSRTVSKSASVRP